MQKTAFPEENFFWQPGFFEEVIGSWEGEPLERPEQLPYEIREELPLLPTTPANLVESMA